VIEDEGASIEADQARLRRILENLFRNGIEHGGTGVTIWVGIEDGRFYVADDGPGIPLAERREVFEYGYSTEQDNAGFGLDIVQSLANAHDWTVTVESSRSGGARFVFEGVTITRTRESCAPADAAEQQDHITD